MYDRTRRARMRLLQQGNRARHYDPVMAVLIMICAAVAGAGLAFVGWLHGIGLIGHIPGWIEPTAVLITAVLVLLMVVDVWRARPR